MRLLAIGDSVLEWNDDNSTPARAAALLNERGIETVVDNRAVSGSCLGPCGDPDAAIATTYSDHGWTHLLVSGGGNDIDEECASADPIISEDLTSGLIIDLIDLAPTSTTVLLYVYAPPINPNDPLASCAEFDRLQARYRALAGARPGVELVDASSIADASTPDLYDDSVHPSPAGFRSDRYSRCGRDRVEPRQLTLRTSYGRQSGLSRRVPVGLGCRTHQVRLACLGCSAPLTVDVGHDAASTVGVPLGLAIVRAIARRHGGDATIRESPLGGAQVAVELPAFGR